MTTQDIQQAYNAADRKDVLRNRSFHGKLRQGDKQAWRCWRELGLSESDVPGEETP